MITKLRYRLDDAVGAPSNAMWSDDELLSYLDAVQAEIAEECRVIHDDESDFCTVDLLAGASTVSLDGSVLSIEDAVLVYGTQQAPLATRESLHELIKVGAWPNPESGVPQVMAPVNSSGKYAFDKQLDADAQLRVVVTRLPLTMCELETELELPFKYQGRMFYGVQAMAFTKPDQETYSATKSDLYRKLYEADKEWVKRTELRSRPKSLKYTVG